jgi:hypothetical protein
VSPGWASAAPKKSCSSSATGVRFCCGASYWATTSFALGAALDIIAWGGVAIHQVSRNNPPPVTPFPRGSKWERVKFPVCVEPRDWRSMAGDVLWGADDEFRARMEKCQPYMTGDPPTAEAPLCVLRELNNIDKHHGINLLATQAQIEPFDLPPDVVFEPEGRWELETGAKVGAFRYLTAEAVERSAVEVGMKYGATFQISLGEGTAAERQADAAVP